MISLDSLIIGNKYDRPYLARLWGYKDFHSIARGIVTPKNSNIIIIFITKEKQNNLSQYNDHFDSDNCLLFMEGEDKHQNDERLIRSQYSDDKVYLFYREKHHTLFEYMGRIYLSYYEINTGRTPSKFVFSTNKFCSESYNHMCFEENTYGNSFDTFTCDSEGKARIQKHIFYERSIKNRSRALEIHGCTCSVCNFNFNNIYGQELASNFIEVHHIKPLSQHEGTVNPETDLVPVCPNCHRMLHRYRNKTLTIDELKNILENNKNK